MLPTVLTIWILTLSLYPSLVKRERISDVNFVPIFEQRLALRTKRVAWHDLAIKTPLRLLSSSTLTWWSLSQSIVDGGLGLGVCPALRVVFCVAFWVAGAAVCFWVCFCVAGAAVCFCVAGAAVCFCVCWDLDVVFTSSSSSLLSLSSSPSRLIDSSSITCLT